MVLLVCSTFFQFFIWILTFTIWGSIILRIDEVHFSFNMKIQIDVKHSEMHWNESLEKVRLAVGNVSTSGSPIKNNKGCYYPVLKISLNSRGKVIK